MSTLEPRSACELSNTISEKIKSRGDALSGKPQQEIAAPRRLMAAGSLASVLASVLAAILLPGYSLAQTPQAAPEHKDYVTDAEAVKVRDAATPGERIKLYLSFAEDRLKKFEDEANRAAPSPDAHRDEELNSLLNAYAGNVDDGADEMEDAQDKSSDIRPELKLMVAKDTEFLGTLEKYDTNGPGLATYKDTLDDAIQATKDAIEDAQEALKAGQTPPARRNP
jgi:hypothetical protein